MRIGKLTVQAILSVVLGLYPIMGNAQRKVCIDHDWKFFLGDGSAAISDHKTVANWRTLDLPHDWSVEPEAAEKSGGTVIGPFSSNSVGKYQTGHTVGGEGWYYRQLNIASTALIGCRHLLYFEGAYNQAEVWLNGQKLYTNPYGYCSFRVDITPHLMAGENTLLVRVLNEGNNTRWYAGSGIYRHVWLVRTPLMHLDKWDTFIRADNLDGIVRIQTHVYNDNFKNKRGSVTVNILDADGISRAHGQVRVKVRQGENTPVTMELKLPSPIGWSPDTPYRYRAVISLTDDRTGEMDEISQVFGFRSMTFSATEGFVLNGQQTFLRGGCLHHDNGLLGAAAYDRAEDRKLSLLKAAGYNAVRCTHNMPSEHFLDACDSIGLMVIDEAFDQWHVAKNQDDYHRFFAEHSRQDVQTMVRRDRNHPCVIMWSIGNEIPGRIEPAGIATAEHLCQAIRELDTTRPITAAICGWDQGDTWNADGHNWNTQDSLAFLSLDVGGYNYLFDKYEHDHHTHPNRVMYGAESYPCQSAENWNMVEKLPYVIGDFVWTAMDYLGEAGIGSASIRTTGRQSMFQQWPWYNGWCGDIDLIGQKKPQSYLRDVLWHRLPVAMGVERPVPAGAYQSVSAWGWPLEQQCWTYPELTANDTMTVNVYSRSPLVRLYLNDNLIGEKTVDNTYRAKFHVPYHPGLLRAISYDDNGETGSFDLQTAGAPVGLRLVADRTEMEADGRDLIYIVIELIDANGHVVTNNSSAHVSLKAEGADQLLAAGNASPTDMASFRSVTPMFYNGRVLAIVKSGRTEGLFRLEATCGDLPSAVIEIRTAK